MKRSSTRWLALAVAAVLAAAPAPAPAGGLGNLGKELGIDLRDLLGGGSSGGGAGLGLVERIIERALPQQVGPAREWKVRLGQDGTRLLEGKLGKVDVSGLDVKTRDGLVIPNMNLHLEGVKVGLSSRTLESVGKGDFTAALGSDAVTQFVRKRAGARVRDVNVAFRGGEIRVKGTPEMLGFGMPAEIAGKPVLNGRDAIDFRASNVSLFGVKLPGMAVNELERRVNPVVDLSGLKLPVRITGLRIRGSQLSASGAVDFSRLR